jgi:uncharacterized 2Fe-2S/4Fe-4S cluster protein (DUF4445 family)|tara:strand:- start:1173 stop:3089 length:1917 start_codon:yes stop_codon:yes gene_type:complete
LVSETGRNRKNDSTSITFLPEGKHLDIKSGSTVLDATRKMGIDIQAPCGDLGLCGRCKIVLGKGKNLAELPTETEKKILSTKELDDGYRLACQCKVSEKGLLSVIVPPESKISQQRIVIQGIMPQFQMSPIVKDTIIELKKKQESKSDSETLLEALSENGFTDVSIGIDAIRRLPDVIREGNWSINATLWNNKEVLSLQPKDKAGQTLGFAVDVGTTKVAGYLVDLKNGELLAAVSLPNPQISFGEDLISRITYWTESEEKGISLQKIVIGCVNKLIEDSCKKFDVTKNEIYDITVVGNTAMHHIFFGISPKYVGQSPFPVAVKNSFDVKAKDIGMIANSAAYVHALPPIAGFVGADTVAGILATEIYNKEETCMLIDVGTNAEIVVGNKDKLTCCSAPAGPAFEGAKIKHGMRASSGAIETVWIDPKTLETGYKTIDETKPRGICGSGIIDTVAQLLKTNVIDDIGRFNKKLNNPRLRILGENTEFVLAWQKDTSINKDITITRHDIQEILLAKAAVYTGTHILLKRLNLKPNDVEKLYIAGAFGTYIDLTNTLTIGMFPEIPTNKIQFVGNTAGSGGRLVLLSEKLRSKAEEIAINTGYIELASDPSFETEFTNALWLPHREKERFPSIMKMFGKH